MKRAFFISVAIFVFVVACGKKDKKLGQAGKTLGQVQKAQVNCDNKKDEEKKKCLEEQAKKSQENKDKDKENPAQVAAGSGAETAKDVVATIPNVRDADLKENSKMAISLNNNTAFVASLRINANDAELIGTKVVCTNLADLKNITEVGAANPDELVNLSAQIFLLNNSSLAADISVKNGDKTDVPKTYLLTCNSGASLRAADYIDASGKSKVKEIEIRRLNIGQQAFEMISDGSNPSKGTVTSFECNNDNDVLTSREKYVGHKVANRIRLRIDSAVLVYRAVDVIQEGNKKLKELGTAAQKDVKYSLISCNG